MPLLQYTLKGQAQGQGLCANQITNSSAESVDQMDWALQHTRDGNLAHEYAQPLLWGAQPTPRWQAMHMHQIASPWQWLMPDKGKLHGMKAA